MQASRVSNWWSTSRSPRLSACARMALKEARTRSHINTTKRSDVLSEAGHARLQTHMAQHEAKNTNRKKMS